MAKKKAAKPAGTNAKTRVRNKQETGTILSGEQKKKLVKQKLKEKKARKVPHSAQDTIAYQEMFRDGICRVDDRHYTKSIAFGDINYQLAQNEDKTAAFEYWCDFYNYFDSSISLQITCMSQYANVAEMTEAIDIPLAGDAFDPVRKEYAGILKTQLAKGNNGLIRRKYVTFGIEADSIRSAKPKLERIETDIMNNLKAMGVAARPLSGYERLKVLYQVMNEDSHDPFLFNFDMVAETGLGTKDFIAPTSFDFRDARYFRMGRTIGAVSFLQILAPELSDKMLADFLDMDNSLIVNLHVQSIDQARAIRQIKGKITDLDKMKIEEQKKAVRSGYDMDVLPSDLVTYGEEAKKLLEDLQSRNERLFLVTVLILNTEKTKQKLDNIIFQTAGIAQKYNCALKRLDYQQEQGLMSSLPIGVNQIDIQRGLTTSATAIFVPFTTEELFQGGEALYYGINAISNNMIMADRKRLRTPNGVILGTPGSGKSFSAKREILSCFLMTRDDVIICDPEGEYFALVGALHGQVVKLATNSKDYLNPMDIQLSHKGDKEALKLKSDFIITLCDLIAGGKDGLENDEKGIIDECIRHIYDAYFENPVPENMPILEDLYNALLDHKNAKAERIANSLVLYVHGSQNYFNHRTNVDSKNRIMCFDIRDLGNQLKELGMLIVQDAVWNRVSQNRERKIATRYYCDEFHLLLKERQTAIYSVEIWKRFRKWGGIPTGLTQNVGDFLKSEEIEGILGNSDFVYLLNQNAKDQAILADKLGLSEKQLSHVTNSEPGSGLILFDNVVIPFVDKYPTDTKTYAIMNTKPEESVKQEDVD